MSGRLQAARLTVLDAAECLALTEGLTAYGDEDLVDEEFSFTTSLAALELAHHLLDLALTEYVTVALEESLND